jgi:hypothetical protein
MDKLKYLEIVHTNVEELKYMKNLEELICLKDKMDMNILSPCVSECPIR